MGHCRCPRTPRGAEPTMSKLSPFHPRLAELTDEWMDLFGYAAPSVVTTTSRSTAPAVRRPR